MLGFSQATLFSAYRRSPEVSYSDSDVKNKHIYRHFCKVMIHIFAITAINQAGNEYCQRKKINKSDTSTVTKPLKYLPHFFVYKVGN